MTQTPPMKRSEYEYFYQDIHNTRLTDPTYASKLKSLKDGPQIPTWRDVPLDANDPGYTPHNEKATRSINSLIEAKDTAKTYAHATEFKRALTNNSSRFDKTNADTLAKEQSFFVDPMNTPPDNIPIFLQHEITETEIKTK